MDAGGWPKTVSYMSMEDSQLEASAAKTGSALRAVVSHEALSDHITSDRSRFAQALLHASATADKQVFLNVSFAYHSCPVASSSVIAPESWLRGEVDAGHVLCDVWHAAGDVREPGECALHSRV